jgi:hypothetical protein
MSVKTSHSVEVEFADVIIQYFVEPSIILEYE